MATARTTQNSRNRHQRSDDNVCPVCHDRVEIFAVGRCDHPICYRCATRMRVLCSQMYCAICRTDLQKMLFLRRPRKFEAVETTSFCIDREFMIFLENAGIDTKYRELLINRCKLCQNAEPFHDFPALRKHMQREHTLFYCDLCVDNLKLFSADRKFYTRQQLAQHRRIGDGDDKSYKGHPLCKFCDEPYFDNDELLRHLRKVHYFCHFCEADGVTNEYFSDYSLLRDHFRSAHILCEEGECCGAEFTNAFRSDIDYRAHWTQRHSSGVGRQQARQMRTLGIDVTFAGRNSDVSSDGYQNRRPRGGGRHAAEPRDGNRNTGSGTGGVKPSVRERKEAERKRREEIDQAHALSASLADAQRYGHISVIDPRLVQNSLTSAEPATTSSSAISSQFQRSAEDFPTLDGFTSTSSGKLKEQGTESELEQSKQPADQAESLTLAKKLALSSRQSVRTGTMAANDFPALARSSSGAQLHHRLTTDNFPALRSSDDSSSAKQSGKRPVASAWVANSAAAKGLPLKAAGKRHEDFPSLQSVKGNTEPAAAASVTVSSLADVSRSFSSGCLSAMSADAESAQCKSWGPELSRKTVELPKQSKEQENLLRLQVKSKSWQKGSSDATKVTNSGVKMSSEFDKARENPQRSVGNGKHELESKTTEKKCQPVQTDKNSRKELVESCDKVMFELGTCEETNAKRSKEGKSGKVNEDSKKHKNNGVTASDSGEQAVSSKSVAKNEQSNGKDFQKSKKKKVPTATLR